MGAKGISRERLPALQNTFTQLCMWLNFDDDSKHHVRQMIDSEYVRPFFKEYRGDYLEAADEIEDVECDDLFRWCISTNAFTNAKYSRSAQPDKGDWTALDHAARFLVRVLRFSWNNGGEWSIGMFDPEATSEGADIEFFQVWAILRYLQAEWEAKYLEDWDIESLTKNFARVKFSRL